MDTLTLDLWTFDVGVDAATPEAYAEQMISRLQDSWKTGADVVVFPEYAWMGLEPHVTGKDKLRSVSELFWHRLWPKVRSGLDSTGRIAVLGTVPFSDDPAGLRNRAIILCDGREIHQDKLHLTPWETMLSPGQELLTFMLDGVSFAVVICLDIEIPEVSVMLRGAAVDCLLVPSATENILGVERVGRCASARAVELCCCVGVSQLVGKTESALVDENVGRLAWFTPSQSAFLETQRQEIGPLHNDGFHRQRVVLDVLRLRRTRSRRAETNPALLTPGVTTLKCAVESSRADSTSSPCKL